MNGTKRIEWIPHTDGVEVKVEYVDKLPEDFLQQAQEWVGGYVEHVLVLHDGRREHMFVNETGALIPLPVNTRATKIYQCAAVTQRGADPQTLSKIHGRAVLLVNFADWEI